MTKGTTDSESIDKRRPVWLMPTIAIVLVLGVVYVVRSVMFSSTHEVTDDAFVTSHVINVSPQVQGVVTKVFAKENQDVKKGDLLAQLEDGVQQAAYEQAKANLDLAIAQAAGAKVNVGLTSATGAAQIQQAAGSVQQNNAGIGWSQNDVKKAQASEASASAMVSSARASVSGAQAGYATALANVSRAKAGIGGAQADLQTAQSNAKAASAAINSAKANADRAVKDAQRSQTLASQGAISAQSAEAAQAAADSALANLDAAQQQAAASEAIVNQRRLAVDAAQEQLKASQAAVEQARSLITASQAQVIAAQAGAMQAVAVRQSATDAVAEARGRAAQARGMMAQAQTSGTQVAISQNAHDQALARVEQAKAALKQADTNLSYTKIYAVADGRVSKITVTVGSLVQPLFPMMSIIPNTADDPMWVTANFKETQLGSLRPGQPVEIEIDGFAGVAFHGKLDSVSGGTGSTFALLPPDNSTGNFTKVVQRVPAKVVFDPGQPDVARLSTGMSATVTVATR